MPVRLGLPMRLNGVSEVLENPAHATGVGLLLWKLRSRDSQAPKAQKKGLGGLLSQMFRLFREKRGNNR
jgi:cell division protein FtsA